MRLAVLHGSPKGEKSVTAQYVRYIEKCMPQVEITFLPVAHDIRALEKRPEAFQAVLDAVSRADAVLWSFPVYFLLVPGQLKRFVELVDERGARAAFGGKYATALSTSVHFYDHTAHDYLHGISEDWGMHYVPGYSAEMEDLRKPEERRQLLRFARSFVTTAAEKRPVPRRCHPVVHDVPLYEAGAVEEVPKRSEERIALLTDAGNQDHNLREMIRVFVASSPCPVDVVNLHDHNLRGGCLGCLRCCLDGHCAYRDGMEAMYRDKVFSARALVHAPRVVDRFFSATWKEACDRQFFNGHRPHLGMKAVGMLVAGPLRQLPLLRTFCEATAQVGLHNSLCPMVTDEDSSADVTANIREMARQVHQDMLDGARTPPTFLGVGGHLIFRDLVYRMRAFFREDYRFYRKNRLLDYPQGDYGARAMNVILEALLRIPRIRQGFQEQMATRMVEPYQKVVEQAGPEN